MPTARRSAWLAAQWLFAIAVVWFAARSLVGQWDEVGARLRGVRPAWGLVASASIIVLLTYALLIEAWRRVLAEWSPPLRWPDAARIWFASNLGKYVPGKIWSILAMGALAHGRGISPVAAGGASILLQLLSIATGIAMAVGFGAVATGAISSTVLVFATLLLFLVVVPRLVPRAFRIIGALSGRELAPPPIPARAMVLGTGATLLSWLASGLAFQMLARSIGIEGGTAAAYVAVYAGSYVAGFVALFAPGGIGVREAALVASMQQAGLATPAQAAVLAIVSRIWLTALELVPGLIALALSRSRVATSPK